MLTPRPRWSTTTKLTIILLLLGFGLYLLYRFQAVIAPFILAVVLAYILSPLANTFESRYHLRRGVATLLAYLVSLAVLVIFPLVFIPPLVGQAQALDVNFRRYLGEFEGLLEQPYTLAGYTINLQTSLEQMAGAIRELLQPMFEQTIRLAIDIISSMIWVIFIGVVSFYLVKDSRALNQWFQSLVPPSYQDDFTYLRAEIGLVWNSFFRGQIVLALVVTAIFTVVGLIIGLPFALTMGLLAGLLEFLPSLGHAIWLIIASLLALFAGSAWLPIPNWAFALIIIGLHLFFQQFDLNYLIPRVIGRRVRLPPLVVILGIVTGALLAGVLGVVLAAPTIASLRVLGRYIYANLLDQDPFPSGAIAQALPPPNPRWWRKTAPAMDDSTHDS
jgi:predicted PurR-regulated permease PerM